MIHPSSAGSSKPLISNEVQNKGFSADGLFFRDPSSVSTKDINLPKLLEQNGQVEEQTLMQVEIVNENFSRKATRSQLASKGTCLTRRWQTAAIAGTILLVLAGAIGGLAYWISLPKVITQPYLLHGESCYMNSRSCDATRMLWCPAGTCKCIGDFDWNTTIQNCSCAPSSMWTGVKCQKYGQYGDPCNKVQCGTSLTCMRVINQTFTTGQDICVCNDTTYLQTSGSNAGKCEPRLTHNQVCQTKFDCQDWLGLSCTNSSGGTRCLCNSRAYWNGSYCTNNALGGEYCSTTSPVVPCDTTRGLTCVSNVCECGSLFYWDNTTAFECLRKKTYAVPCTYNFECNTTVGLSCPINGTGCNCPSTSTGGMCDCQFRKFWDGQRCVDQHTFNGTCPGQHACLANTTLVCFLGHCVCPGNQVWNVNLPNNCACPSNTVWNSVINTCECPTGTRWNTTLNACA